MIGFAQRPRRKQRAQRAFAAEGDFQMLASSPVAPSTIESGFAAESYPLRSLLPLRTPREPLSKAVA